MYVNHKMNMLIVESFILSTYKKNRNNINYNTNRKTNFCNVNRSTVIRQFVSRKGNFSFLTHFLRWDWMSTGKDRQKNFAVESIFSSLNPCANNVTKWHAFFTISLNIDSLTFLWFITMSISWWFIVSAQASHLLYFHWSVTHAAGQRYAVTIAMLSTFTSGI